MYSANRGEYKQRPGRVPAISHASRCGVKKLQTLSEATQRISDAAKVKNQNIEWSRIAAFRNVVVHNYLGIDLEIVWEITQRDVPELKRAITILLEEGH